MRGAGRNLGQQQSRKPPRPVLHAHDYIEDRLPPTVDIAAEILMSLKAEDSLGGFGGATGIRLTEHEQIGKQSQDAVLPARDGAYAI